MIVAIPSKGRPDKVTSLAPLGGRATLFVPANEVDAYAMAAGGDAINVIAVPGAVRGITATRNWILDWAVDVGDPRVVFVDDDVRKAGFLEVQETRMRSRTLTPDQWEREFEVLFDVAEGAGFSVWGVATMSAPRAVYPYRPLIFRTYVTASCMGMRADRGVRFDESFPVKEDYELCLRMIRDEGGVLGARYLFWENEHWSTEGGCKDYRTLEIEERAIANLEAKYPGWVRRVRRGGVTVSVDLTV